MVSFTWVGIGGVGGSVASVKFKLICANSSLIDHAVILTLSLHRYDLRDFLSLHQMRI